MDRGYVVVLKLTDQKIIEFFKQKYNDDVAQPSEAILDDPNFYDHGPERLSEMLGDKEEAYFFTKILGNYQNLDFPQRRNVDGVWKLVSIPEDIKEANQTIGTKTTLGFERRIGSPKTGWFVDEYMTMDTDQPPLGEETLYEWVLCKLYYAKPKRSRARSRLLQ